MSIMKHHHSPTAIPSRAKLVLAALATGVCGLVCAQVFTVNYAYDAAGQLVTAFHAVDGTNSAVHYVYDPAGNMTNRLQIGGGDSESDSDADGLADLMELRYFGHLGETGAGDPDTDGLSNSNELAFGSSPVLKNTDGDPQDDYAEWIADTNPTNAASYFQLTSIVGTPPVRVYFQGSSNRVYTLRFATNLLPGGWTNVPGQARIPGSGTSGYLTDTNSAPQRFYRVRVELP
jgi:YD repeat-containing protein